MSDPEGRYAEALRRMQRGEPLTEALWLHHFEHQNAGAVSGVPVGEPAPDFELPDQSGKLRSRAELMQSSGLLLVFARSADW